MTRFTPRRERRRRSGRATVWTPRESARRVHGSAYGVAPGLRGGSTARDGSVARTGFFAGRASLFVFHPARRKPARGIFSSRPSWSARALSSPTWLRLRRSPRSQTRVCPLPSTPQTPPPPPAPHRRLASPAFTKQRRRGWAKYHHRAPGSLSLDVHLPSSRDPGSRHSPERSRAREPRVIPDRRHGDTELCGRLGYVLG